MNRWHNQPRHILRYQRPPEVRLESVDLPEIPERPFSPPSRKGTRKLLRPGQETLPNVIVIDPFTPTIPPSRALEVRSQREEQR